MQEAKPNMAGKRMKRKIAVIGAGPSGLMAVKSCKEEGLDVVCYEKTSTYGGSWNYRNDTIEGVGSIRKCTVSLYCKEMNAFSDYPPPQEAPNYMNHEHMMDYIDSYAENYGLLQHVQLEHEVIQVMPSRDFDDTGKWIVKVKLANSSEQQLIEQVFDGVIVCTGKRGYTKEPSFPKQEKFQGDIIHSKFLKTASQFENKNVLIVGFGNSAVETAIEISPLAKQVYLSVRSGSWVVPRVGKKGRPSDLQFLRRNVHLMQKLDYKKICRHVEANVNSIFDHDVYKIKPDHDILAKHPVVSDELPDKILTGRVVIKGNIERFEKDGVIFEYEDHVTKIDNVIYATGYQVKFPFLDSHLYTIDDSSVAMYKFIFPIDIKHQTLAIIGLVHPMGPTIPVWESQCRLTSMIFSKKLALPSRESMLLAIENDTRHLSKRFVKTSTTIQQVDYIEYMDDLASLYGSKLNISGLFTKHPILYWNCFIGPCLPYQYRLYGPHSWKGAREAILKWEERTFFPLRNSKTKSLASEKSKILSRTWISASLLSLALCLVLNCINIP